MLGQGLEAVRAAQMGVKVTLGALFLTAAVVLGSGSSLNSTPFLASAAAFGTGAVLCSLIDVSQIFLCQIAFQRCLIL